MCGEEDDGKNVSNLHSLLFQTILIGVMFPSQMLMSAFLQT